MREFVLKICCDALNLIQVSSRKLLERRANQLNPRSLFRLTPQKGKTTCLGRKVEVSSKCETGKWNVPGNGTSLSSFLSSGTHARKAYFINLICERNATALVKWKDKVRRERKKRKERNGRRRRRFRATRWNRIAVRRNGRRRKRRERRRGEPDHKRTIETKGRIPEKGRKRQPPPFAAICARSR